MIGAKTTLSLSLTAGKSRLEGIEKTLRQQSRQPTDADPHDARTTLPTFLWQREHVEIRLECPRFWKRVRDQYSWVCILSSIFSSWQDLQHSRDS